jgi:hypothetical protein
MAGREKGNTEGSKVKNLYACYTSTAAILLKVQNIKKGCKCK